MKRSKRRAWPRRDSSTRVARDWRWWWLNATLKHSASLSSSHTPYCSTAPPQPRAPAAWQAALHCLLTTGLQCCSTSLVTADDVPVRLGMGRMFKHRPSDSWSIQPMFNHSSHSQPDWDITSYHWASRAVLETCGQEAFKVANQWLGHIVQRIWVLAPAGVSVASENKLRDHKHRCLNCGWGSTSGWIRVCCLFLQKT